MYTRKQIIEAARSQIDVRFQHQARVPFVAVDCIGLLVVVSKLLGFDPHDFGTYGRDPDPAQLLTHIRQGMDEISPGSAIPGDAYCFWWSEKTKPQHFAIISAPNTIIHSHAMIRRVTEQPIPPEWKAQIHSAWRFKEVA